MTRGRNKCSRLDDDEHCLLLYKALKSIKMIENYLVGISESFQWFFAFPDSRPVTLVRVFAPVGWWFIAPVRLFSQCLSCQRLNRRRVAQLATRRRSPSANRPGGFGGARSWAPMASSSRDPGGWEDGMVAFQGMPRGTGAVVRHQMSVMTCGMTCGMMTWPSPQAAR